MDALTALKERRSVRVFQKKVVPREVIRDIVDCGRLAATARNIQPWEFVIVTKEETRKKIAAISDYGKFIAQAPVCIALFCQNTKYYLEDGSAATENLLLAATAHGLGSCWVAGDKKPYADEIRRLLEVPEGYRLVSLVAIGVPGENPQPKKRTLEEVIHWEKWSGLEKEKIT
ncbi:MAG: nitroreductase family protein [Candidatus Omnitrophica bacterium]|nr:nitroreductase family protein [Candidatus Omnitrophota bacterium]